MLGNVSFSMEGSFIDLIDQRIPNWSRSSPVYLEKTVAGSLQLYGVESFRPAFYLEDGSFLLEPKGINECTWSRDLTQNVWVKRGKYCFGQGEQCNWGRWGSASQHNFLGSWNRFRHQPDFKSNL